MASNAYHRAKAQDLLDRAGDRILEVEFGRAKVLAMLATAHALLALGHETEVTDDEDGPLDH